MPRLGQNLFTSRRFADSDSAAFGFDSFTRLAGAPDASVRLMQLALDGAATSFSSPKADAVASGLPANYEPVESAWYIPGPTAIVDKYTPASNTTGTLVV